jgi:hypothetical protein
MLRHMGPPMLPTPMKPTFIVVFPCVLLTASMAYRVTDGQGQQVQRRDRAVRVAQEFVGLLAETAALDDVRTQATGGSHLVHP